MIDPVKKILAFNAGRDPERLAMKYRAMRADPFVFLRGTCHLFYDRLPAEASPKAAPPAWVCGDLHLQNFGSFKGDNRLTYFDINDFDEGALAPATWDLFRLMTSVLVARDVMRLGLDDALALCGVFLDAYCDALGGGTPRWVDRDDSQGPVRELLESLRERRRVDFLNRRTELSGAGGARRLRLPPPGVALADLPQLPKTLPVAPSEAGKVREFMASFAAAQADPAFFEVLDVARRVAGTGSLGVERYVVLVQGKGSPDRNYLIDLKRALPSSLTRHLSIRQPRWASPADRVVALQRRMQAASMAFLHPVTMAGQPFVLRALQPAEDRVAFSEPTPRLADLKLLLATMGRLVAWAQLRSAGREGSATADELIDFSGRRKWRRQLEGAVVISDTQVRGDWSLYCKAFDDGAFTVPKGD